MKHIRRDWREWLTFIALAGPNLGLFVIFTYFTYAPMVGNVLLSFQEYDLIRSSGAWVGLRNFETVFSSSQTSRILINTFIFTVASVGGVLSLGMFGGLLLNQPLRGRNAARSILFSPFIISGAAIAIV